MISLSVSWDANAASEQVTGYKVYMDGTLVGSPAAASFKITNVSAGTHSVSVSAVNAVTEGPQSDPVSISVPAAPSKVRNVHVSITFDLS